jgi:hypothetical protein
VAERLGQAARLALRLAVSLALVAAVGAIAHLPLGEPASGAALRIALRTHQARIEVCRDLTAEELARLPAHMRRPRECRETPIDYRLRVVVDGEARLERLIRHRGIRRSRPLTVDELLPVAPGVRDVAIDFLPELPADLAADAGELPTLRLAGDLRFPTGRIRIATLRAGELVWLPAPPDARP